MSKQITPYEQKVATLRQALLKSEKDILKAIPGHIDKGRLFRVYMTAVQVTRGLVDCEPISVLGSVFQAAQFGLSLDTVQGEAFLIPRYNKMRKCKVAQFQIGYKGFNKLARNADQELRDVFAYTVHENDVFEFELGLKPALKVHRPAMRDRGEPVAAYAVAVWKDGYTRFEIVLEEDIERILRSSDSYQRAISDGSKDTPWITHKPAMWRKSSLRRLGNTLPLSGDSDLAKALRAETIDGQTFMQSGGDVSVVPAAAMQSDESEAAGASPDADPKSVLDEAADAAEKAEAAAEKPAAEKPAADKPQGGGKGKKEEKPRVQRQKRGQSKAQQGTAG
jgi:recombination protein RecT